MDPFHDKRVFNRAGSKPDGYLIKRPIVPFTINGLPDFTFSSFLLVSSIVTAVTKTMPEQI